MNSVSEHHKWKRFPIAEQKQAFIACYWFFFSYFFFFVSKVFHEFTPDVHPSIFRTCWIPARAHPSFWRQGIPWTRCQCVLEPHNHIQSLLGKSKNHQLTDKAWFWTVGGNPVKTQGTHAMNTQNPHRKVPSGIGTRDSWYEAGVLLLRHCATLLQMLYGIACKDSPKKYFFSVLRHKF